MSRQGNQLNRDRSANNETDIHWTCVATAPDQMVAEMWQQILREESIPSMLAPQDAVSFLGLASTPVRLLVPGSLKHRAEEALTGVNGE